MAGIALNWNLNRINRSWCSKHEYAFG